VDRPGLLDEISSFLFDRDANICDSRLINLHGGFAMLLLIRAGHERAIERVREDLPRLAAGSRIHLDLQPADDHRETECFAYHFTASGADQAGLLQKISHLFRALNINIDHVEAHVPPQETNCPSFSMELLLSVPRQTPISMLRDYLDHLCKEIGIQWRLDPA
jgi:glycine cleavage system regulatory protein